MREGGGEGGGRGEGGGEGEWEGGGERRRKEKGRGGDEENGRKRRGEKENGVRWGGGGGGREWCMHEYTVFAIQISRKKNSSKEACVEDLFSALQVLIRKIRKNNTTLKRH